jgi:dolichol-phosphate mannosyltransferase
MSADGIELSVVVPVYGCRDCIAELHRRLIEVTDGLPGETEFVFVDDRGTDGAWDEICRLAVHDRRIRGFRLSRNFGQQAAITAGLAKARGRWIVVMDCDLQDPPEQIPRLYAKAAEGYDVVLARRLHRSDSIPRRMFARIYFHLLNVFAGASIDGDFGSFSIISRKVAESFLRFRDRDRHYLFVLRWLGFEQGAIDYEQASRYAGRSSYSLRMLVRHATQGMFFQTTVLLRWIVHTGFAIALAGGAAAVYLVVARLNGSGYPGWTSLAVLTLIVGGVIIISTGITGLYIGRVFEEVRERPLYVIDEIVGDESADGTRTAEPATTERVR